MLGDRGIIEVKDGMSYCQYGIFKKSPSDGRVGPLHSRFHLLANLITYFHIHKRV
jgi:hypothetical protein